MTKMAEGMYSVSPEGECVALAYIELAKMPHGVLRAKAQGLLAGLRDLLAEDSGADPEYVQNYIEASAKSAVDDRRTRLANLGLKP